ncbi:unnamed protein product [Linum trigynum]|uniref:Retrotransposon Copia-like N-terminal domain-containing protein n=1 Tax=Linum trigynum TaxID=586398 RepID=A0AAV2E8N0_9ROSI
MSGKEDSSSTKRSEGDKEVLVPSHYEDPYSNPFYLAPSDNSSLSVISFKLNDDNYLLWSESMEVALRTKNKLGFVLGSIQVPDITNPSYGTWDRVNGTVVCWIRNFVAEDIVPSLRNIKTFMRLGNTSSLSSVKAIL